MTRVHGHGPLTDGDRARIFDLAAAGVKSPTIAKHISRHPATVHWFMYSSGLVAPRELPPGRAASYQRGGRTVYRFTPEEALLSRRFGSNGRITASRSWQSCQASASGSSAAPTRCSAA